MTMCAMCGEEMPNQTASAFSIPPALVELMQNSDGYYPDEICEKVTINLCGDHHEKSKDMVSRGETPLPMCDAEYVNISDGDDAKTMAALLDAERDDDADMDVVVESITNHDLTGKMVQDALAVMKAVSDGETNHIMSHEIHQAKVIFYSLEEMDMIS
jgi:hypothetical protein